MPRWLSEGISVYEERRANPSWGERLTPRYREMLLGEDRTPVAELSAAFLMPRSAEHLQFAYYQSSLVVEYLVDRHGPEKLAAVLRELRTGTDIGAALEQHIAPMDEIEAGFATFAEQTARAFGPGLDWEKPDLETLLTAQASSNRAPRALLEMFSGSGGTRWDDWAASRPSNFWVMTRTAQRLVKEEKWAEAKPLVEQLIRSCPEFIGDDGAYAMLAGIHHALGEADAEREALTEWARRDDEALDAYRRLMELASETGDWSKVAEQARRYLAVDPLVPLPYRFLADAARELQELETAIRAYRALLELNPANPAEVHFRLATLLHQRGDPGARRHLLQALEDAPRYQEALRLLLDLNEAERGGEARTEPQQEPVQGGGIQRDGARVCDPQQDPQTGETGAGHDHHYAILSSAAAVEGAKGMLRDGSVHSVCESCCGSPTRGPRANLDPTANAPTKGGGGAGFPTCCIADFQVGRPCEIETSAGWETRDTADLEVCATVVAPSCVRGPQHLRVDPAPYPAWPVGNGTAGL
jgi:tetratricopeptide (TPR) repeat protein